MLAHDLRKSILQGEFPNFLEYMLWKITERQVIYQLKKKRRVRSSSREVIKNPDGSIVYQGQTFSDITRQNDGLKRDEFEHMLFFEEFSGRFPLSLFKRIYMKWRPIYFEHFFSDTREIIDICIKNGSIKPTHRTDGVYIKEDIEAARRLLSVFYYPRILIEYEPVRGVIKEGIKWLAIAFLGYVGISQTITATTNAIIDR